MRSRRATHARPALVLAGLLALGGLAGCSDDGNDDGNDESGGVATSGVGTAPTPTAGPSEIEASAPGPGPLGPSLASSPTGTPAGPAVSPSSRDAATPRDRQPCDYLDATDVSALLGSQVDGVPQSEQSCAWGELALTISASTPREFDEERTINSVDAEAPSLGLGDDSYVIIGEPGGFGSAGVLVGGTKALLTLPGEFSRDQQRLILGQFITEVAAQL